MNNMILAEENIQLAYKLAWEYFNKFKTSIELEELQAISLLGLTKAAKSYNSDKNIKFSTFAYTVIKNEIIYYIKQNIKHINNISLSQELTDNLLLEDTLQSNINLEKDIEDTIKIETLYKYINELNEKDKFIVLSYLNGLNTHQIATKLKITDHQVNSLYRKIINKLRYKYRQGGDFEW